jgi:hypothetical protein
MTPMRSVEEWVALLGAASEPEREKAALALADALASDVEALRERAALALLSGLGCGAGAVPLHALAVLQASWWEIPERLAGRGADALYGLLEQAQDLPGEAVEDAALLFARVAQLSPTAREVVRSALDAPGSRLRQAGALAAARVGEAAATWTPKVASLAGDVDPDVALAAVEALASLVRLQPDQALPVLTREVALGPGARRYAALAGIHGWLAEARLLSAQSVTRTPPELADALQAALSDEDIPSRLEAAAILGLLPTPFGQALAALRARLEDPSADVAAAAACALLRHGDQPAAVAVLQRQLASEDSEIWCAALGALDSLEPAALKRAAPALQTQATSEAEVGEAARELLARLG